MLVSEPGVSSAYSARWLLPSSGPMAEPLGPPQLLPVVKLVGNVLVGAHSPGEVEGLQALTM
jgi:hypothetical protein